MACLGRSHRAAVVAVAILAFPALAMAADCTCASRCDTAHGAKWKGGAGCRDRTGPDAGDTITVDPGGTVTLSEPEMTFGWIWVKNGGTLTRSGSVAQVLTLASSRAGGSNAITGRASVRNIFTFLECEPGSVCSLASTPSRPPLEIAWSGNKSTSGCAGRPCTNLDAPLWLSGNVGDNLNPITDASISWTGQEKVQASAAYYGDGATADDYVECIYAPATPIVAVADGDTIVFTSGRSDGYWYKVVDMTTECAHQCDTDGDGIAGEECTYQVARNATDPAFNSHLMATGRDETPARHATPLDSNGDGVADPAGTRPAAGDSFVIFTPAKFHGQDLADPFNRGPMFWFNTLKLNMRYVEMYGLGAYKNECTVPSGWSTGVFNLVTPIASTHDIAYVNIHDSAGESVLENQPTNRTNDSRPNYPRTLRYWYIHDRSPADPGCTNYTLSGGLNMTGDFGDAKTEEFSGLFFDHMHFARLGSPRAITLNGFSATTTNQPADIVFRDTIIEETPKTDTYPTGSAGRSGPALISLSAGVGTIIDGLTVANIGNNAYSLPLVVFWPREKGAVNGALNSAQVSNAFVVNYDTNSQSNRNLGKLIYTDGDLGPGERAVDTSTFVLSNSYVSNVVGGAGVGGAYAYNLFRNMNLENTVGGCADGMDDILFEPAEVTGNVFTRDLADSTVCTNKTINYDSTLYWGQDVDTFSVGSRNVVSNLFVGGIDDAGPAVDSGVIQFRDADWARSSINTDIRNNVFDMGGAPPGSKGDRNSSIDAYSYQGRDATRGLVTISNNILADSPNTGLICNSRTQLAEDYNLFWNVAIAVYPGTVAPHDIVYTYNTSPRSPMGTPLGRDSGGDLLSGIECDGSSRIGTVSGPTIGPILYGVTVFAGFHPSALDLLNADVYRLRFDRRDCPGWNQDEPPRPPDHP